MREKEFRIALMAKLCQEYPEAKISITFIHRARYEMDYCSSFRIPAVIDFKEPVVIVEVRKDNKKETFIAYIDKRGKGLICPQDKIQRQQVSRMLAF